MIEIIPEIEDMTPEVAAESIDSVVEVKKKQVFYDTTKNWNSDKTRIAQKGVIYVYSDYAKAPAFGGEVDVPAIKIGDGTSYLIDMPFAQGEINEEIRSHIANQKIHVSDEDRKRWDAATSTANVAKNTADAATSTANTANDTAKAAKNTADAASTTAGQAKATADGAKSTADAAKSTAETNATDLTNYITSNNSTLEVMQSLIDGSIMTWFFPRPPADANEPTSKWTTTDLKNQHLGDLYYDTDTGYCYRYQVEHQVYSWQRITDVDVTKALADAKNAQDTADGKRRVFTVQPTPPYDVGDLWAAGANGDIKRCRIAKTSEQSYAASDWELACKYTDDTTANAAKSTADSANSKIDNMQIGGRNLILNSAFNNLEQAHNIPEKWDVWGTTDASVERSVKTDAKGVQWYHVKTQNVGSIWNGIHQIIGGIVPNAQYTLSFYAYGSGKDNIIIHHDTEDGSGILYQSHFSEFLSSTPKKYTYTFTGVNNENLNFFNLMIGAQNNSEVYISKIKLERGNQATDWTPAPEDVEATADSAKSTADSANSKINNLKVGGRNLLKGTSMDSKAVTTPTTASTVRGSGFTFPEDASRRAVIPYGAEYRCSVDVLLPVDGSIVVDMNNYAEVGTSWTRGNDNDNMSRRTANAFNVKANVWTRISWGSENTNDANTGKQAIYVKDSVGLLPQSAAVTWHYRGLKVELGNKATDWTPAPEDVDAAIEQLNTRIDELSKRITDLTNDVRGGN